MRVRLCKFAGELSQDARVGSPRTVYAHLACIICIIEFEDV